MFGLNAQEVRARYPKVYQHCSDREAERDQNPDAAYPDAGGCLADARLSCVRRSLNLRAISPRSKPPNTASSSFSTLDTAGQQARRDWLYDAYSRRSFFPLSCASGHCAPADGLASAMTPLLQIPLLRSFPFPASRRPQRHRIGQIARRTRCPSQARAGGTAHLTLTGLYNVLERCGQADRPDDLDAKQRRIFDDGLVLILKELHEKLDAAVAEAYGWPADLPRKRCWPGWWRSTRARARGGGTA